MSGDFPLLRGDASRLLQIATNLVGNALKFTEQGQVLVRLSTDPVPTENLAFTLEVEDTGIGIAPEKIPSLFEPFTQAHRHLGLDHGGCGLGLSICHRLAQLMQGSLTVQSEVGKGSIFCFKVSLPIEKSLAAQAIPPQIDYSLPTLSGRVLLVEDVAVNRLVAEKFLRRLGLQVDSAHDGRQGVAAYLQQDYDWILMDCQMPVMDGFEATREIRRLAAEGKGQPHPIIIALTANAQPEDRIRCFEAGMDGFLEKPIASDTLQSTLQRLMVPSLAARAKTENPERKGA